jgi:hypothetical protein
MATTIDHEPSRGIGIIKAKDSELCGVRGIMNSEGQKLKYSLVEIKYKTFYELAINFLDSNFTSLEK